MTLCLYLILNVIARSLSPILCNTIKLPHSNANIILNSLSSFDSALGWSIFQFATLQQWQRQRPRKISCAEPSLNRWRLRKRLAILFLLVSLAYYFIINNPTNGLYVEEEEIVMKMLLDENANVESKDNYAWTPLSWAAKNGHKMVVKMLLENNADVGSKDESSWKPLLCAARKGHGAADKNADVESKDNKEGHRSHGLLTKATRW
jgi:Ankyrin repeats (3 copies)